MSALLGGGSAALAIASLFALKAAHAAEGGRFDLSGALRDVVLPTDVAGALTLAGIVCCALVSGLFTAAVVAARRRPLDGGAHRPTAAGGPR